MKKKITITLSPEAQAALVAYGKERHINGGLSGVIEHFGWRAICEAKESKENEKKQDVEKN